MKLFVVFSALLVCLFLAQLVDSCGGISIPSRARRQRAKPFRNRTKASINESAVLEIIQPQEGNSVLWSIVEDGARLGLHECQQLFENETWNCPLEMYKKSLIFDNTTFPYPTRETAFIHAISAAAITHEITLQCAQGKIPGCGCPKPNKPKEYFRRSGVSWGCGDNIKFGEKEARRLTDRLEKGHDVAQAAVNQHNNEVGIEVVRTSAEISCKCHGINTACAVRTCWKELAHFELVASKLKQKYDNAVRVWFVDNKLQERVNNRLRAVSSKDQKLVYLDSSTDHCVQNDTLGFPGMLGRSCRSDKTMDKCKSFIDLCKSCKLKVQRVERYKQIKCKCMFVWCCKVECEECTEKYSELTCTLKAVQKGIEARAHL